MTKPLLAILLLLTLVAASVRAGMIDDKGSWSSLNYAHQTGYVLAAIDSHYYFFSKDTSEEEETEKAQHASAKPARDIPAEIDGLCPQIGE